MVDNFCGLFLNSFSAVDIFAKKVQSSSLGRKDIHSFYKVWENFVDKYIETLSFFY